MAFFLDITKYFCNYLSVSTKICTFAPDKEPLKQAGGSTSRVLSIRKLRQNTEVRRFSNCNLENCAIPQTSRKHRKFKNFFQSYKKTISS